MKKIEGVPFVLLKKNEHDAEKKRFAYLKTPIKGFYYVTSEAERKSRTLFPDRFVPALLGALQKEKKIRMQYGIITSAWNCSLSWRPVKFVEVFNSRKTFDVDFAKFSGRYAGLRSYYSKTISHFYASLSIKRLIFRKVRLLPPQCIAYDDRYLAGFYISRACILKNMKRYAPRNAKGFLMLKNEYAALISDMRKVA